MPYLPAEKFLAATMCSLLVRATVAGGEQDYVPGDRLRAREGVVSQLLRQDLWG